jgi:hypothetical protein
VSLWFEVRLCLLLAGPSDDAKITHQDTVANTVHIDIPSLNGQLQLAPSRTNIRVYEETHRKKIAAKLVDMLKL